MERSDRNSSSSFDPNPRQERAYGPVRTKRIFVYFAKISIVSSILHVRTVILQVQVPLLIKTKVRQAKTSIQELTKAGNGEKCAETSGKIRLASAGGGQVFGQLMGFVPRRLESKDGRKYLSKIEEEKCNISSQPHRDWHVIEPLWLSNNGVFKCVHGYQIENLVEPKFVEIFGRARHILST